MGSREEMREKEREELTGKVKEKNICTKVPGSLKRDGKSILCKHGSATPSYVIIDFIRDCSKVTDRHLHIAVQLAF